MCTAEKVALEDPGGSDDDTLDQVLHHSYGRDVGEQEDNLVEIRWWHY